MKPLVMSGRSRSNADACFLVLLAALVGSANTCHADSLQRLRPVVLTVTDAASKKPLSGIVVHYLVLRSTYRTSTLGVLPPIEPFIERGVVSKLTGYTDANGEVSFQGVEIPLRTYIVRPREDKIDSEMFFVNLEPSEEAKRRLSFEDRENDRYELFVRTLPELDRVTHPNPAYKGYLLQTVPSISQAHGREQEKVTVHFQPEDFARHDTAAFSVPLRRSSRPN